MKKNILFICSNMDIGGFQKSLITLLNNFEYDKYNVDLLLTTPKGILMDYIPKNVNIISIPPYIYATLKDKEIYKLLFKKPKIFLLKLLASLFFRFNKCKSAYFSALTYPEINKNYDVAIDYCGQSLLYYLVKKINAKKKISFFHSDYKKWNYYYSYDKYYYQFVDYIVTISPKCVDSMKELFPQFQDKIICIENITTKETINLFQKNINPYTNIKEDYIIISSIGRISKEKGNDIAIEAASILKKRKIKFVWYFVGPSNDTIYKNKIDNLIEKYDLKDYIIFTGQTDNPYDYMMYADIIAMPSRFEGKAVAIDESLILNKIVVATNFSTVYDQIKNNETGIITDMNPNSFAEGLIKVITNTKLRDTIKGNLKRFKGNYDEINKLYDLIEKNKI